MLPRSGGALHTAERYSLLTAGSLVQPLPGVPQSQPAPLADWQSRLPMPPWAIKLAMPLPSHYPPSYDPTTQSAPAAGPERPLSDIRAVMVVVC